MLPAFLLSLFLVGCEVTEGPRQHSQREFTPPKDGKITRDMAATYIEASKFLLDAIGKHEMTILEFSEKYKLSEDLSELADSAFREEHKDIVKAWDRLVHSWEEIEKEAYEKAGITEEEFNWIGGALTDPINRDIQEMVVEGLTEE